MKRWAMLLIGATGIAYETLIDHDDRPMAIVMFAAMMGLPVYLDSEPVKRFLPDVPDWLRGDYPKPGH